MSRRAARSQALGVFDACEQHQAQVPLIYISAAVAHAQLQSSPTLPRWPVLANRWSNANGSIPACLVRAQWDPAAESCGGLQKK